MEQYHFPTSQRVLGGRIAAAGKSNGPRFCNMSHEIAKLILEHAGTFLEREEAVRTAIRLGMPLNEIEAYLDWLDIVQVRDDTRDEERDKDSDRARP